MATGGRRRRALIAATAIGLAVAVYLTVRTAAEAQLTRLLPPAIAAAVGGRDAAAYSVTLGSLRLALTLNGVHAADLRVSLDSTASREMAEPALVQRAALRSVRVAGLRLIPLLRGRGVYVTSIEIDGPSLALHLPERPMRAGESVGDEAPGEETADPGSFRPPRTMLTRVRIRDGSVEVTRVTRRGTLTSLLHGFDLTLTEIAIDSVTFANPARALANSRVTMTFDTAYHVLGDSLYFFVVTDLRAGSRDSLVEVGTVQFTPTLEAAPFFGRLPRRADRLNVSAGPIRVEGLDFASYVRDKAVRVRRIEVDSLDLHVYSDIALDWGTKAEPCRYHMPFAEIPVPFRVDTVEFSNGSIRYSELAKGSKRPGELSFADVRGAITNLTNDPNRMTRANPAVASLGGRLYGAAPVSVTVRYPLLSPTLDFDVQAALGAMNLEPANRFVTNVTGVEVEGGRLDSLWVEVESRDGQATGRVHMRYRDLDFRLVDRNTGKEMAWHAVLGFVGNVAVRASNPGKPDGKPRDGRIEYACGDGDMVFFEFLVHALATGLKRIVLIL